MAMKALNLENVRIMFRNFEGREGMYNKAGERSFAVILDRQTADQLAQEGWNVKFPKEREGVVDPDEEGRDPYLQVSVGFDYYPANVFLISEGAEPVKLGEHEVAMLDWAEIQTIDLVLRPYEWSVNRNTGIKAYLKSGYFTIVTDKFANKYGING